MISVEMMHEKNYAFQRMEKEIRQSMTCQHFNTKTTCAE